MIKKLKEGNRMILKGNEPGRLLRFRMALLLSAAVLVSLPATASAYVGPGAGLSMIGSALALIVVVLVALAGLVIWPLRALQRRKRKLKKPE